MKCGETRTMHNPVQTKSKRGSDMIRGTCSQCGTKMVKFGRM